MKETGGMPGGDEVVRKAAVFIEALARRRDSGCETAGGGQPVGSGHGVRLYSFTALFRKKSRRCCSGNGIGRTMSGSS